MSSASMPADAPAMRTLAQSLSRAVEQVLMAGLTAAGQSTQEHLAVSMKEAARMRLLRLGSTIRVVGEEINRFDRDPKRFSPQRLSFFLNRTWILCRGIAQAIDTENVDALNRLLASPPITTVKELKLGLLGVIKRIAPGVFNAFEFRMIALADAPPVSRGMQVVWSCVFPSKAGADIPPEAFLQLPQKQGFKPSAMLSRKANVFSDANISMDDAGVARLTLNDTSKLNTAEETITWPDLVAWNPAVAARRVAAAVVTPIDLEIEMQELVRLDDWSIEVPKDAPDELSSSDWPLNAGKLRYMIRTDAGPSGEPARLALTKAAKSKDPRPALVGLLHYESCQFVVLPMSLLSPDGPDYLTLAHTQISAAELVKALKLK
ncbi:MAG TPA: hypothetical protein VL992_20505 [Tepidisphaeraceae bacterium]|nr:hypothetical protein [Tepidisphaeraceae bacterium]